MNLKKEKNHQVDKQTHRGWVWKKTFGTPSLDSYP